MLTINDFDYILPEERIAQTPLYPRDSSRLLVYRRKEDRVEHKIFRDIVDYLQPGDVLVVNNTKVLPARIFAHTPHGGAVELLLLKRLDKDEWEVMVKPGKKARPGATLTVNEELSVTVEAVLEEGLRRVRFHYEGVFEDILSRVGTMPLPPYIREKLDDQARYQTVYGKINGSAAAPTAGLHFTPDLLEKIKQKGVTVTQVLLHVGLGTFRPVKETNVQDHKMHSEYYEISEETAQIINCAKREGRRVIAVGTTSVRTLETVADEQGMVQKASGETQIFLYPPYQMKCVDALITNFHLPKSTLIMLVATLTGREKILDLYNLAVAENYRFFSFGDAMFIE
ncbi:MAG: tRNA preQ1(34) S-adenosylmethionine ribosyltransferase-isomerase QueA [Clostridia bacterium]|nr:tRNA preQ1(34) S-adenosylmethionine ribosyltransferase-isomerase QueA [Clostridia bacterium]MBQ1943004.1 tRNA preQ1(34) S-adenosylmethionine ribosyltransferase-isomerase QueA [Clostridia bacterium]